MTKPDRGFWPCRNKRKKNGWPSSRPRPRQSRQRAAVAVELEGKLINSMTGQPEPLDTNAWPRYFVFLRGQSTCPITRGFALTFIKYCNGIKSSHP